MSCDELSFRLPVYSAWLTIRCCSFARVKAGSSTTTVNFPLLLLKSSWYFAYEQDVHSHGQPSEIESYIALDICQQPHALHFRIIYDNCWFRLGVMSTKNYKFNRENRVGHLRTHGNKASSRNLWHFWHWESFHTLYISNILYARTRRGTNQSHKNSPLGGKKAGKEGHANQG